ncbi:MAG TPA: isoaspartyl peptidase/L-asparaginase [Aggregatilinea sp.]|uniref:isoaspartyl peptidase/L-asparaginase n=1 Tax=Aggregatilinea sp. TaxID=2806333 RepID=UPI002C93DD44|nr:isoaspartyl peptidase/L-asparaginase [Aggregatilinea sp.]HML22164.1 isoaspartyl peptidase/L-asparaginase [Aggregatilinea sp.]
MKPTIMVHGGAWKIAEDTHAAHIEGTRAAAQAGWDILTRGGSALDAVEAAVALMEDDPTFDAGIGSVLNRVGEIELDAMIMDGRTLALGAVAAVRGITNPVRLARLIMEDTDHSLLVGDGARRFAEMKGMRLCAQAELTVPREVDRFRVLQQTPDYHLSDGFTPDPMDTVGAVAIDVNGNVAASTSTGGVHFKMPGRVGDSPLVGAGAYADNRTGAASATGHGESIMRVLLSKTATDAIERGMSAQDAADFAVRTMHERVGGYGGIILVDFRGQVAFAYNTPHMAAAWVEADGTIRARIKE